MVTQEAQDVAYWMMEREHIRLQKEAKKPKPWTADPILRQYRFCNLRREDDAVTRWIATNWRNPNVSSPMFLRAMVLARTINWPPTLAEIGFPHVWEPKRIVDVINQRARLGKAWGSAYIVSTNGRAVPKPQYVVYDVCGGVPATLPHPRTLTSLQTFYGALQLYNGIGSFMAGQIIADLKNTPGHPLERAHDWWLWACPGPGSLKGIARYFKGRERDIRESNFFKNLHTIQDEVGPLLPESGQFDLHAQDWQNVMCEMGKYWRTKDGRGRPKATYSPNPPFPGIL